MISDIVMIYFNNRNGSSGLTRRLILFRCKDTTEAQGLKVLGGGKGSGLTLTKDSKGNLASHIRRPMQQYNI